MLQASPQYVTVIDEELAERRAAQARVRAERAALRAAARAIPPQRDAGYAHLSLSQMRTHRREVAEAEERIGYWQRVATQRLDAVRGLGADLDVTRMNAELAVKSLDRTRTTLMNTSRRALPPLPTSSSVWIDLTTSDAADTLTKVIAELEIYREALATTAKGATAELIARYRQTPSDCLAILPA
jgi:hypothetical protein